MSWCALFHLYKSFQWLKWLVTSILNLVLLQLRCFWKRVIKQGTKILQFRLINGVELFAIVCITNRRNKLANILWIACLCRAHEKSTNFSKISKAILKIRYFLSSCFCLAVVERNYLIESVIFNTILNWIQFPSFHNVICTVFVATAVRIACATC